MASVSNLLHPLRIDSTQKYPAGITLSFAKVATVTFVLGIVFLHKPSVSLHLAPYIKKVLTFRGTRGKGLFAHTPLPDQSQLASVQL